MKKAYGLLLFCLLLHQAAPAQEAGGGRLPELGWLAGKWERLDTRPGETAFEEWSAHAAGLKGRGVTLRGADTVFVENLSIQQKEGALYYIAEVSHNAEPTPFKITRITGSGFVCENPDHDFPKKIEYRLEAPDTLKAIISGGGRSSTFSFRKKSTGN